MKTTDRVLISVLLYTALLLWIAGPETARAMSNCRTAFQDRVAPIYQKLSERSFDPRRETREDLRAEAMFAITDGLYGVRGPRLPLTAVRDLAWRVLTEPRRALSARNLESDMKLLNGYLIRIQIAEPGELQAGALGLNDWLRLLQAAPVGLAAVFGNEFSYTKNLNFESTLAAALENSAAIGEKLSFSDRTVVIAMLTTYLRSKQEQARASLTYQQTHHVIWPLVGLNLGPFQKNRDLQADLRFVHLMRELVQFLKADPVPLTKAWSAGVAASIETALNEGDAARAAAAP